MQEIPFRPLAQILKMKTSYKFKTNSPIEKDLLETLQNMITEEISYFDIDYKPLILINERLNFPVKVLNHLSVSESNQEPKSLFELGYVVQQLLLILSHFRFNYSAIKTESCFLMPFALDGSILSDNKTAPGYARLKAIPINELLYFEKWGDHPDEFFKDNPKMESVIRYSRFAPRMDGSEPLKFIMDKETLHLIAAISPTDDSVTDWNASLINAGFILYNFITAAKMLNLKGEWKLLREMDSPDKTRFLLPDKSRHIATWHGQLW